MQNTTTIEMKDVRRAATNHNRRLVRRADRNEIAQMLRGGVVDGIERTFQDVICERDTFTTADVAAGHEDDTDATAIIGSVLHAAEEVGAIRPTGDGWAVVDQELIYGNPPFKAALNKLRFAA
jgi:hypothetical protein